MNQKEQVFKQVNERGETTNKELSDLLGFQASDYLTLLKKEGRIYNENGKWYVEGSQVPNRPVVTSRAVGEQEWKPVARFVRADYLWVGDAYMYETWVDYKFVDGDDLRNAIIMQGEMPLLLDFQARIVMDADGDLTIEALVVKETK
jgi:hypothetical protein